MHRIVRLASLSAALCLIFLLSGCRLTGLHVVIPDFSASTVQGVRVYRVDEGSGQLVDAGRIEFGALTKTSQGERISCTHIGPSGQIYGPVDAVVSRPASYPSGVDVRVPFVNPLPAGWFRVSSYNTKGASAPSADRVWVL